MNNSRDFLPNLFYDQPSKPITQSVLTLFFGLALGIFGGFAFFTYVVIGVSLWDVRTPQDVDAFSVNVGQTIESRTYADLARFLENDKTNEAKYGVGVFDCKEYALFTWAHAIQVGFNAVPVIVKLDAPYNHMILAFETSDRGIVFVEPQSDNEVFPATWTKYFGFDIVGLYYLDMSTIPVLGKYPPLS
ncbi:hypothetical protein ABFB09_09060 [Dehalogenimonas sp. THU2]|uniref:hypothetical protein n=1 Tax=Dehalogenimonas sp. THU2 TaxID=3151121 RepID=UPI003218C666